VTTVLGFPVEAWGSPAIGTYLIPGTSVKLTIRKEIAPLLVAVARDFDREVEPLHPGWCWGFNPKHIEGSTSWSNHAWGGAIDLNAPDHPMGKANTFTPAKRVTIRRILARYTYQGKKLIRWGGDYAGRKDDMHWEINVPRAVALAAVKALQTPAKPPATPTGNKPGSRILRVLSPQMKGADVTFAQRWTGAEPDGVYGPATKTRVIRYQGIVGVPKTGNVDAATWSKMLGRTIKL
jgi:hypothetical protein